MSNINNNKRGSVDPQSVIEPSPESPSKRRTDAKRVQNHRTDLYIINEFDSAVAKLYREQHEILAQLRNITKDEHEKCIDEIKRCRVEMVRLASAENQARGELERVTQELNELKESWDREAAKARQLEADRRKYWLSFNAAKTENLELENEVERLTARVNELQARLDGGYERSMLNWAAEQFNVESDEEVESCIEQAAIVERVLQRYNVGSPQELSEILANATHHEFPQETGAVVELVGELPPDYQHQSEESNDSSISIDLSEFPTTPERIEVIDISSEEEPEVSVAAPSLDYNLDVIDINVSEVEAESSYSGSHVVPPASEPSPRVQLAGVLANMNLEGSENISPTTAAALEIFSRKSHTRFETVLFAVRACAGDRNKPRTIKQILNYVRTYDHDHIDKAFVKKTLRENDDLRYGSDEDPLAFRSARTENGHSRWQINPHGTVDSIPGRHGAISKDWVDLYFLRLPLSWITPDHE